MGTAEERPFLLLRTWGLALWEQGFVKLEGGLLLGLSRPEGREGLG